MNKKPTLLLYALAALIYLCVPVHAEDYSTTKNASHAFEATSGDLTLSCTTITKTGGPAGSSIPYEYIYLGANSAAFLSNDAKVSFTTLTLTSNAPYAQGIFLLGSQSGNSKPTASITDATLLTFSAHSDGAYNANAQLTLTSTDIGTGRLNTSSYSPAITTYGNHATTILTDTYAWTSGDYSPVLKVYSADNATLTATASEFASYGKGSPVLYTTGVAQITTSSMNADCSAGVEIDGNGKVTLTNTSMDLEHITGKDTTHPAVLIGSSISGDASFSMTGGHIVTDKGDIFSVTGTKAAITLSGVAITNADTSANFLKAASGNSTTSAVTLTVLGQTIGGNITANTGSTIAANMSDGTVFYGSVNRNNPNGAVSMTLNSSTWYLTANSYVTSLTNGGTIIAGAHKLYVDGILYSNDVNFYSEAEAASSDVIAITTLALPSGKTDTAYSAYIDAVSPSNVSFDVADGAIPDGLTLDEATGELSGTPTTAGTYTFIVEAYNKNYITAQQYTIFITDGSASTISIATTKLNDASTYSAYSAALAASGAGTVTWSIESGFSLPDGLTLDGETGIISGTPTKTGSYTFMVRATVSEKNYDTKLLTIKVIEGSDVFLITTQSLKDATVNKNYSVVLKAKGSGTLTWTAEGLPDGLSLDASKGKISGKPTTAGTYNVAFTVTNGTESAPSSLPIYVKDVKPKIKASVKAGMIDTAYTATVTVSAGTGSIDLVLSGDLPKGLTYIVEKPTPDKPTLTISGKPTEGWNGEIEITASNTGWEVSKKCKLKIKAIKPKFTFKNPPVATFNEPYTAEATLIGSQPLVLDIKGLPAGLSYDYDSFDEVVKIYGTPTEGGKFSVKMTATNVQGKGSKSAKIVVNFPPEIQDFTLEDAYTGKSYSAKFKADGTKKILWSVESGDLPEGLTLKTSNGQLKGKPTEGGEFSFYIVATNSYGSDARSVDLVVNVTPPKISTNSLKKGKYNKAYSVKIKTKDGTPDTWTLTGDLPAGITFKDGVFSGTPTEAFNGSVTVTATNAGGSASKTYTLVIAADAPKITTASLPSGTVGQVYSAVLEATGTPPIVWRWSGAPTGLKLSKDTGVITGTPRKSGTYKITVTAENSAKIVSKKYKVEISGNDDDDDAVDDTGALPEESGLEDDSAGVVQELAEYYGSTGELPEGFVIAAELGEVSADVSGMYEFDVTLSEEAPVGAKMYWVANSESPSDDDGIAEFFGMDGQEIDAVPENRKVRVSAWLNAGVIYRPVIAVKQ